MPWIGSGINYGHHATSYDLDGQVARDFALLKQLGVTKLRIVYPPFDSANVGNIQALVQRALSAGFYVIWGVTAGGTTVTTSRWASFKSYVTSTLAPWAQAQNNSNLQLSVGNEEELHIDGTTVTASTVRSDVGGTYGSAVKSAYTKGLISYETAATQRAAWASLGKGNLDKIGFNVYFEVDPTGNFTASISAIVSGFGSSGYISEWSTPGGYSDLGTEVGWSDNLMARKAIIQASGVSDAYAFCYKDGAFGVPADSFALMASGETPRIALASLSNKVIVQFK